MDHVNSSIAIIIPAYNESPLEIVESQTNSIISNGHGDVNQHGAETEKYIQQKSQKSTCCCCPEKHESYGTYPSAKETIVLQTYITEKQVYEMPPRKQNDVYDPQPRKLMNELPSPSPNQSPCCSCCSPKENHPMKYKEKMVLKEYKPDRGPFENKTAKQLPNPPPNESPCCSCCQSPKNNNDPPPNNLHIRTQKGQPNPSPNQSPDCLCCQSPKNSYDNQPNNQPVGTAKENLSPSPNESPCSSCCKSPKKEQRPYVKMKPIPPVQNKYDKPVYQYRVPEIDPITDSSFAVEHVEPKISTYVDSEVESKSIQISRTENDKSAALLSARSTTVKSPTQATLVSQRSTMISPASDVGAHSKRLLGQIGNEVIRRVFPPYIEDERKNYKMTGTNIEETKNTFDGTTIDSINHLLMECAMKLAATQGEKDNYWSDNDSMKRYCQVPMRYIPTNRNENVEFNRNDQYPYNKSGRNYPASAVHNDMTGNNDSYEFIKNTFNRLSDWVHHFPNTEDQAHLSCGPNSLAGQNSCFKVEVCEAPCGKETIVINKI